MVNIDLDAQFINEFCNWYFHSRTREPLPRGLLIGQHPCYALLDVGELCIAIRMAVPLVHLVVALQAELLLFEHFTNDGVTDPMAKRAQFGGQTSDAFAGPAQRRHGVAPLARRHQRQQIATAFDGSQYMAGLRTRFDFGCIQYEPLTDEGTNERLAAEQERKV